MSKKGSSYENIYTQQINDALGDQSGYESKKAQEKRENLARNNTMKRQVRALGGFSVVLVLAGCLYFISLDPANAGPAGMAFGVFLMLAGVIWFMNR